MSNRIPNTVPGTRKRAGEKSIFPSAGAKQATLSGNFFQAPAAAGGGGGAGTGASGPDITTFINITYADYIRITDVEALGNINIVQQPGKAENRSTLSTATQIVESKDVLVVIEQNNTIYDVDHKKYVKRDGDVHATNRRTAVINAITGTKSGSVANASRPSSALSTTSSTTSSVFGSTSSSVGTPSGTPRGHTTDKPTRLPHKFDMTQNTEHVDESVYPFFRLYERERTTDKDAFLKNIKDKELQHKLINATSTIATPNNGLDHRSILTQHFTHNNKLAQTKESNSTLHDFPVAVDARNITLKVNDKIHVDMVPRNMKKILHINDEGQIMQILANNIVSIRRNGGNSDVKIDASHLTQIQKYSIRGGGKETRRKRTTKSNNNKTRSNRNKNI
jgi:hypothetical protein